jgi:hypothetical protein
MKSALLFTTCLLLLSALGMAQDKPASLPDITKLREMALRIDQQVAAFYRNQKLPVPAVTDDATFLRRSFLVTIGRVPSVEESLPFLEMEDAAKRTMLIDYLLQSPGYSSHMTNWAFDLLRVTDRGADRSIPLAPYRHWIRQSIRDNMPWNEFTHKLLASSGDAWDPASAAVGYYTRDRGMPLDNLSNTMRIFLGERMECAQCHDDPFGTMERHDFYQLAAFTHGQQPLSRRAIQPVWDEWNDEKNRNTHEYRVAQMLWDQIFNASLGSGGTGRIPLPQDYQYRDGKPGEIVGARTPYGKPTRMSDRQQHDDGREKFAEWITSRTDKRFAGVIANRMWKRIMGRGLYEPVDEYKKTSETHHPVLAQLLEDLMIELKYDLRSFQHVLLLTRTFQFDTNPDASKIESGDDFHGRKIARLTAEQIWDSLLTLAIGDPDKLPPASLDTRVRINGRPVLTGQKTMPELSREVLAIKDPSDMRKYFNKLVADIGSGGDSASTSMMQQGRTYSSSSLVRASELPSPAPRDHLLYLFGSSDREVVDAASSEPNVSQVLSLMNGFVQDKLINNPDANFYQCLEGTTTDEQKIRRLYLTILNRPPSSEELQWMTEELQQSGPQAPRNIAAALIMCSEFLFLQ